MRSPATRDAHFLEPFNAEILEAVGQRRTDAGVVLMVAHPLDFHVPAIDENAVG